MSLRAAAAGARGRCPSEQQQLEPEIDVSHSTAAGARDRCPSEQQQLERWMSLRAAAVRAKDRFPQSSSWPKQI